MRPIPSLRLALFVLALSLFALTATVAATPRVRGTRIDPRRHLHRHASALGRIDMRRARRFRHFRPLVRWQIRQADDHPDTVARVRAMLSHADEIWVSMVRGAGRTAEIGTVLLHGDFRPNEVPRAVQSILPGVLAPLWEETEIEGKRAFDVGMGALVQLGPTDWLLSRRIEDELPVSPAPPPPALSGPEFEALAERAGFGRHLAEGVLIGDESTDSDQLAPDGFGFLYHRTHQAWGYVRAWGSAETRFELHGHDAEDAQWRQEYFEDRLTRIARGLEGDEPSSETPMQWEVQREEEVVRVGAHLDRAHLDAYVARLIDGRLLSEPTEPEGEAAEPPREPSREE